MNVLVGGMGPQQRGKFRILNLDTREGRGVNVSIPGGTDIPGQSSLVTSFSATQRENYSIAQCLNGRTFLYTFGHDPSTSQFSLGVTTFLNGECNSEGLGGASDLADALKAYGSGRVSSKHSMASLSVGDALLQGYLVGQELRAVDTEIGAVSTVYTFVALAPQGGGASA